MRKVFHMIDIFNEKVGKLFGWFILALIATMVYEVISRYVFHSPTLWSYDATYMLSSVVVTMGFAWTYREKGHVRVDVVYNLFPAKVRLLLDILLTPLLFFLFMSVGLYAMLQDVIHSWGIHELASISSIKPPIYPFKSWILFALILLLIQGVVEWIRDIIELSGGERP